MRLSEAAWIHKILVSHPEFDDDQAYEQGPKYLCVVYREAEPVGFVITAFYLAVW